MPADASAGGVEERKTAINPLELARLARQALDRKKGKDIRLLDVRNISDLTDYTVIASGSSPPHLKALLSEVQHEMKQRGVLSHRKTGDPESGWLVLDYVDVVIHIFSPSLREYYAVEELWSQAPEID